MTVKPLTPLMRQYFAIKEGYPDTILLFQVGDFYELFFDDAVTAASVLGIALTKRGTHNGEPVPLCGVPLHVRDHYLTKLVKAGYKVALCEQLEAPVPGKVVERGVTQVLTPGTLTDTKLLDEKTASYLATFYPTERSWTFLCAELLTGHLYVTQIADCSHNSFEAELSRFMPDEIVLPDTKMGNSWAPFFQRQGFVVSLEHFSQNSTDASEWFSKQFNKKIPGESFSGALGLLYSYLSRTNEQGLSELKQLSVYNPEEYVILDAATQRNLELVKNAQDGTSKHTLFSVLDKAVTPMGSRMLKKWLLRPLVSKERIEQRLDAVEAVVIDHPYKTGLRSELKTVGDTERIVGRIALKRAHLHDYRSLLTALQAVPSIKRLLLSKKATLFQTIGNVIQDFSSLSLLLQSSLHEDSSSDWIIKSGYNAELDRLRDLIKNGAQALSALELKEQKRTGIGSLKVKYNQVHGYSFEVTKPNLSSVPDDFIRTQTLSNRERFTTQELKDLEYDLKRARSESAQLEKELYEELKKQVEQYTPALKKLAHALAYSDSVAALAQCAYTQGYIRPTFNENRKIEITDGRHPVVEQRVKESFIPNSVSLTDDASLWIITGPNMGGKSTFLRQVALISLLGQIGSFVPAVKADLSLVDRIFTRIGASDNVAEGKSTFLVEMEETALICSQATEKSLVILDEVGRGTSTFDGLAIAQAVVEYIHETLKARCLFATHYHELTALCDSVPGIKPFYAASTKVDNAIVLLHKIMPGVADGSFGLEVAVLAQLPDKVVKRARSVLQQLKATETALSHYAQPADVQEQEHHSLILRSQELEEYVTQLEKDRETEKYIAAQVAQLDCDELTPKQALGILWSLKEGKK